MGCVVNQYSTLCSLTVFLVLIRFLNKNPAILFKWSFVHVLFISSHLRLSFSFSWKKQSRWLLSKIYSKKYFGKIWMCCTWIKGYAMMYFKLRRGNIDMIFYIPWPQAETGLTNSASVCIELFIKWLMLVL